MSKPISTFTEKQINEVEALSAYLNCEQIGDYFGISHDTFTRIKNRQSEVMRAYKKGKAKAITLMGKTLIDKAQEGDTTAIIFYLKTQAGWSTSEGKSYIKSKFNFSKNQSPLEAINSILNALEMGEIAIHEATQLANLINLKISIESTEKDEVNVFRRETTEERRLSIERMQEIIDRAERLKN